MLYTTLTVLLTQESFINCSDSTQCQLFDLFKTKASQKPMFLLLCSLNRSKNFKKTKTKNSFGIKCDGRSQTSLSLRNSAHVSSLALALSCSPPIPAPTMSFSMSLLGGFQSPSSRRAKVSLAEVSDKYFSIIKLIKYFDPCLFSTG